MCKTITLALYYAVGCSFKVVLKTYQAICSVVNFYSAGVVTKESTLRLLNLQLQRHRFSGLERLKSKGEIFLKRGMLFVATQMFTALAL
jgi:hypothetical protein